MKLFAAFYRIGLEQQAPEFVCFTDVQLKMSSGAQNQAHSRQYKQCKYFEISTAAPQQKLYNKYETEQVAFVHPRSLRWEERSWELGGTTQSHCLGKK